ncbi:MAG: DUF4062 domain-containing protein [Nitrospira sp.]|nr:DUF4062 domain-containing protein [Nitrospira sp.]
MNRPRIFLSAVSEELRTVRRSVAATVRTLGFDPVSQDDFPTGYGELRGWLREQVDSCEGLIQLIGQAYGAEPPDVDPDYGRVSYTQFEFLYAQKQGKKTWVIVIGKDFELDKPIVELDLPQGHDHSDPFGYQIERRRLQQNYLTKLKQENHLRHTANTGTELQNIILRLRDDLGELRREGERRERRLTKAVIAILLGLAILGTGGWWGYQQLQVGVQQVSLVNTEKIRAHLLQTTEETHRRELAEAETSPDWKKRQELREAADTAHRLRRSRIEELAASFAEIEGRGTSTNIFQEMTRILSEQGVDEAIAYVGAQRSSILQTVRTRATVVRERNRADLQPLLRTAGLLQAKGQATEARNLYTDIFAVEPDWPEALHAFFWFLTDQGDLARVHTTLVKTKRDYEEAHRVAQRLTSSDPGNTEWQRDLSVSHHKLGDVAVAQGKLDQAAQAYRDGLTIAKSLAASDPGNTDWQRDLSVSYDRLGDVARAQDKLDQAAQAYRDSLTIAKSHAASDPGNTDWQRDLWVSYWKLADLAERQKHISEARGYWKQAFDVLSEIDKRGLHLSPEDRQHLDRLRQKAGLDAG